MNTISIEEFASNPSMYIRQAMAGDYLKVTGDNGNAAIIIDESEWSMLCEALKLCIGHPEWTIKS